MGKGKRKRIYGLSGSGGGGGNFGPTEAGERERAWPHGLAGP
jgi:hypothetical protein